MRNERLGGGRRNVDSEAFGQVVRWNAGFESLADGKMPKERTPLLHGKS